MFPPCPLPVFIAKSFANDLFTARLVCLPQKMVVYVDYMKPEDAFTGDCPVCPGHPIRSCAGIVYTEGSYDDHECFEEVDSKSRFTFTIEYDRCKTKMDVS